MQIITSCKWIDTAKRTSLIYMVAQTSVYRQISHGTSFLIAVTGERLTSVGGMVGVMTAHYKKIIPYKNPFWNEIAFFATNQGYPFHSALSYKVFSGYLWPFC